MNIVDGKFEFDWDEGNITKSWDKHGISFVEAEQVFFNEPLIIFDDNWHSKDEDRFYCLGETNSKDKLFISFTMRVGLIRIISARPMSRRERKIYEEIKKDSKI